VYTVGSVDPVVEGAVAHDTYSKTSRGGGDQEKEKGQWKLTTRYRGGNVGNCKFVFKKKDIAAVGTDRKLGEEAIGNIEKKKGASARA